MAQRRLLSLALGVAAAAIAFGVALTLGRSLTGGAEGPLLMPLAVCGALALGLGVASVVATEVAQPEGAERARRVLTVAAPLATIVALFAYSSDPATSVRMPLVSAPTVEPFATRPVSPGDPILGNSPVDPATQGRPPARPAAPGNGRVAAPPAGGSLVEGPGAVAGPPAGSGNGAAPVAGPPAGPPVVVAPGDTGGEPGVPPVPPPPAVERPDRGPARNPAPRGPDPADPAERPGDPAARAPRDPAQRPGSRPQISGPGTGRPGVDRPAPRRPGAKRASAGRGVGRPGMKAATPAATSVRSWSRGCRGLHRGWGRILKAPRPRACTKR